MRLVVNSQATADPVLAIRWCFGQDEVRRIFAIGEDSRLQVLIAVKYDNGTEDRHLFPHDQAMTYVGFRRPGVHQLYGALVYSDRGECKSLLKMDSPGIYRRRLTWENAIDRNHFNYNFGRIQATAEPIEVLIPQEHFPKEPPQWLKSLADYPFNFPSRDQCQLRRRMLGVPLKVPFLLLWAIFTVILRIFAFGLLWIGTVKGISFKPIFHPFSMDTRDILENSSRQYIKDSWFVGKLDKYPWLFPFHPWMLAAELFVVTLIKLVFHTTYWRMLRAAIHGLFFMLTHGWAFFVGMAIAAGITYVFLRYLKSDAWKESLRARREARQHEMEEEYEELMTCRVGLTADISSIPVRKRSVRLIYLDVKRKVCRPFAS